jgi:predicted RNA-binding protein Jag
MIAYQALVLFPDNTKKAFYIDLRGKTVDAIQTLVKHMLTVIKEKVPNYKLIKLVGTGNFCDARASFMSH